MKGKLAVLIGAGVGYVLGTKAGRERYEQIRSNAQRLWQDPRVTEKRQQAAHVARDQASAAKDAVTEKVNEKVHHGSGAGSTGSTGGTSGYGGTGTTGGTSSVSANDLPDAPSTPV